MDEKYHISFKQLYYFLSVAEQLSFTRAAQEHYIAQTAMSRNILTLEQALGVTLFERTKRSVALTEAGKSFYNDAKKLTEDLHASVSRARQIENGYRSTIRIGLQGIHEQQFLPRILRLFREQYPQIEIDLVQDSLRRLGAMLENRKLDLIFTLTSDARTSTAIDEYIYMQAPLCAVLPNSHPLAGKKKIRRQVLAAEPIIFIKPENSSGTYEAMLNDCRRAGFEPRIFAYTENVESTLMQIDAGAGVSFFPKCCENTLHNISFVPLEGDNPVELSVRWRADTTNEAVRLLIKIIKEQCVHI